MKRLRFALVARAVVAIVSFSWIAAADADVHAAESDAPIRALLVCGGCCHDYAHQKEIITVKQSTP